MTELEKLVSEIKSMAQEAHDDLLNKFSSVHDRLSRAENVLLAINTKLDAAADKVGQPLLDSRMTGAVYAAIVLVAILFGAKAF